RPLLRQLLTPELPKRDGTKSGQSPVARTHKAPGWTVICVTLNKNSIDVLDPVLPTDYLTQHFPDYQCSSLVIGADLELVCAKTENVVGDTQYCIVLTGAYLYSSRQQQLFGLLQNCFSHFLRPLQDLHLLHKPLVALIQRLPHFHQLYDQHHRSQNKNDQQR